MGEGVARVVATDREGTRVRTLSQEIARMRIRLTAVLTELDRRRDNAIDVKHLAREHAGAVAAGALVLAAIVATPVLKVRRRRQRRWAHQGVTLTVRARVAWRGRSGALRTIPIALPRSCRHVCSGSRRRRWPHY